MPVDNVMRSAKRSKPGVKPIGIRYDGPRRGQSRNATQSRSVLGSFRSDRSRRD